MNRGSGFGGVVCHADVKEGAKVVVDMNLEAAEWVATNLKTAGGKAAAVQVDVAKSAYFVAMVPQTLKIFGRGDVMVHNAGMSYPNRPMLEVDEAFLIGSTR